MRARRNEVQRNQHDSEELHRFCQAHGISIALTGTVTGAKRDVSPPALVADQPAASAPDEDAPDIDAPTADGKAGPAGSALRKPDASHDIGRCTSGDAPP